MDSKEDKFTFSDDEEQQTTVQHKSSENMSLEQMANDIKNKLENLDEINQACVEVTFDPPWNPEMITDEAKEKLGINLSSPQERKEPTINTEWE